MNLNQLLKDTFGTEVALGYHDDCRTMLSGAVSKISTNTRRLDTARGLLLACDLIRRASPMAARGAPRYRLTSLGAQYALSPN